MQMCSIVEILDVDTYFSYKTNYKTIMDGTQTALVKQFMLNASKNL